MNCTRLDALQRQLPRALVTVLIGSFGGGLLRPAALREPDLVATCLLDLLAESIVTSRRTRLQARPQLRELALIEVGGEKVPLRCTPINVRAAECPVFGMGGQDRVNVAKGVVSITGPEIVPGGGLLTLVTICRNFLHCGRTDISETCQLSDLIEVL